MMALVLGILLLFYSLAQIPAMIKRKHAVGHYFSADKRILVAKSENMGNNLNMQNKYAFFINLLCALLLIVYGTYLLFH